MRPAFIFIFSIFTLNCLIYIISRKQIYLLSMQTLLESLIETGNPELIEKYVYKYLPKDQDNLQRIYNQLNKYDPPKKNNKQQIPLIREIKKFQKRNYNQTPIEYSIRKSKSLISVLKQKGIQPIQQNQEKGLKLAQKERDRFLKPLQTNPIAPFLKKGKVNELCNKYQLNKQFYENPPAGFDITNFGYDPEMSQFIQKRKRLLKAIEQKKPNNFSQTKKPKRYESISSKINKNIHSQNNLASQLGQTAQKQQTKQMLKNEAKQIMDSCKQFYKIKANPNAFIAGSNNIFSQLQQKMQLEDDIDIDAALKTKFKDSVVSEKLERYNLPYMTYLKQKQDYRSMSHLKKQLLKDQIKMRGIVNFKD